ncbi:MAG: EamA family transporter [Clostridia bacterium]|nr:EamA family transporter [Clostridia bacterium]
MLGYLFIFISVFFGVTKGFGSKKVSGSVKNLRDNLDISLYRNALCCVFSFITALVVGGTSFSFNITEILISAIAGITMAVFISSWLFAIQSDSYMLVSASASSSFIVPAVLGVFFLGETLTLKKILAFVIIVIALFFLLKYNTKLNGKITVKSLLLLATVLLSQGINQAMQKIYTYSFPEKDASHFTFYSAVFTVIAILVMMPFAKRDKTAEKASVLLYPKVLIYATIMALALFGNTYFLTLASKSVDALILYPVANALSLGAASAMSAIFFGEKMNRDSIIGVILVFIALVLAR